MPTIDFIVGTAGRRLLFREWWLVVDYLTHG